MGLCVCAGAKIKCSMGDNEVDLSVLPVPIKIDGNPLVSVMNYIPYLNIPSFGQCKSPANPMVIAAYGAPQTCVPVTITPWSPGAKKLKVLGGTPALLEDDKNMCMWAGQIEITDPGQTEFKAE
jgi:hypothetical protein